LVSRATPRPKRFAQQPVLQRVVVVPRDCSCAATSAIPSDKYLGIRRWRLRDPAETFALISALIIKVPAAATS
jgi:hypothetical protein